MSCHLLTLFPPVLRQLQNDVCKGVSVGDSISRINGLSASGMTFNGRLESDGRHDDDNYIDDNDVMMMIMIMIIVIVVMMMIMMKIVMMMKLMLIVIVMYDDGG